MKTSIRIFLALLTALVGGVPSGAVAQTFPQVSGSANITSARYTAPTDRYPHFVQGRRYEAGGLAVTLRDGRTVSMMLDENYVFEDGKPRLADLDGDGEDEIIVILTSLSKGAALAAYEVKGETIALKAQTPFIGTRFRWLNPAGIADFNGDGRLDVAFVAMPHLVKRLELWSLQNNTFRRWGAYEGYSNHRNGSVHTQMSAVADFDGDGIADLALPEADRRTIAVLSFAGGTRNVLGRVKLPIAADGAFKVLASGSKGTIEVGLETGRRVKVALEP